MVLDGGVFGRVVLGGPEAGALVGEERDGEVMGCELLDDDEEAVFAVDGAEVRVGDVAAAFVRCVVRECGRVGEGRIEGAWCAAEIFFVDGCADDDARLEFGF